MTERRLKEHLSGRTLLKVMRALIFSSSSFGKDVNLLVGPPRPAHVRGHSLCAGQTCSALCTSLCVNPRGRASLSHREDGKASPSSSECATVGRAERPCHLEAPLRVPAGCAAYV
eukprot:3891150-Pleurochrysis_carterae.AAC.3